MKSVIALLVLFVILHVPISCNEPCMDSCCGETFTARFITITEISSSIGIYENNEYSEDQSTNPDSAAIRIFTTDAIVNKLSSYSDGKVGSLISQSLACSPPPPRPTQKISLIEVTATENLYASGKEFKPEQIINELFKVSNSDSCSIEEFIDIQNNDLWQFSGYPNSHIVLQLINKPDSVINQKLGIKIMLDSDEFQLETDTLRIE